MNKKESIISSIVQLLIFANTVALGLGFTVFAGVTPDMWYTVVSLIVQLGSILWSIWKNHNFTEAALDGQTVINRSKGKIDLTEVNQEVERVSSGVDVDFSEDEEEG